MARCHKVFGPSIGVLQRFLSIFCAYVLNMKLSLIAKRQSTVFPPKNINIVLSKLSAWMA